MLKYKCIQGDVKFKFFVKCVWFKAHESQHCVCLSSAKGFKLFGWQTAVFFRYFSPKDVAHQAVILLYFICYTVIVLFMVSCMKLNPVPIVSEMFKMRQVLLYCGKLWQPHSVIAVWNSIHIQSCQRGTPVHLFLMIGLKYGKGDKAWSADTLSL